MTETTSRIHHLTGDHRRRGRRPVAVFRAVTRRDLSPARTITLRRAIAETVGFDTIATAIGTTPSHVANNLSVGTRGVRPEDARRITNILNAHRLLHEEPSELYRIDDLFIDTRSLTPESRP